MSLLLEFATKILDHSLFITGSTLVVRLYYTLAPAALLHLQASRLRASLTHDAT